MQTDVQAPEKGAGMAVDKRGRKLPKGIRQRYEDFEGRFMYQGKRYLVHGSTVTETQKAMTDLKYELEHGLYVEKKKMTFDEWYGTWMEVYKKNSVKIGTYTCYQKYYKSVIKKQFGDKLLTDIRGEHIQKFYNDLIKEGYALSTISVISAVINGCLQQAMRNGLIERNPVRLAEIPRKTGKSLPGAEKKSRQAMTKEQQALFMEYAKESYLYNLFEVMLRTGMRSGEVRGFIYGLDVDKRKRVIHIQRTLKYQNDRGFFSDTPKTKSSERDIPLTKEVEKYLDMQQKLWWGNVIRMDRYLFCRFDGDPLDGNRLQREIDRIIRKIRDEGHEFPRITAHVFRHTFATRAIEAGMQPQVLKAILGHSSLAMTMDLYSHVLPDMKAEEMEKIASAF